MKNIILTIKLILLLVFAGISNVLFAADLINEGFEGSTSFPAGWTDNSAYVQNNVANAHGGTYYAGMNLTDDWIRTPQVTNPGTLTFWARTSSDPDNWVVKVQTSPDGSIWTDRLTLTEDGAGGDITDTYAQFSVDINLGGDYYIRWYMVSRSLGSFYMDDVVLTDGTENIFTLETMYNGTGGTSGDAISTHESNDRFENDALTMSGTGDMRTTSPSSGYTDASGTWNVMLDNNTEYFQIEGINTSNYANIELAFGLKEASSTVASGDFKVEVSSDGTNWTGLTITFSGDTDWDWITPSGTIPSTSNLRIKFTNTHSTTWDFRIDDVKLTGVDEDVDDLSNFNATSAGQTQIDLSWTKNGNSDDVLIVYDFDNTFTDPVDGTTYTVSSSALGGTVIYNGSGTSYNHTSLAEGTDYYYKAWSVHGSAGSEKYSPGVTDDALPLKIPGPNDVIINEYNDDGGSSSTINGIDMGNEWIELYVVDGPVNLRNWYITDEEWTTLPTINEGALQIKDNTDFRNIKTGTYILLVDGTGTDDTDGSDKLITLYSGNSNLTKTNSFALSNSDDGIALVKDDDSSPGEKDSGETAIDYVSWGAERDVPTGLTWVTAISGTEDEDSYFSNTTNYNNDAAANWTTDAENPDTDRTPLAPNPGQGLSAEDTKTVSSTGTYQFNGQNTGIEMVVNSITGSGDITVKRFSSHPGYRSGVSESTISQYRWFFSKDATITAINVDIKFILNDIPNYGIDENANDIILYKRANQGNGSFASEGTLTYNNNSTSGNLSDDWMSISGITDFSEFIFATNGTSTLPVELIDFHAKINGIVVDLFWSTASEINNDYFTMEHSKDAVNFEIIGIYKGSGNSDVYNNYSGKDYFPYPDISYYRLKQTDFNGKYKYSEVIHINNFISKTDFNINNFYIDLSGNLRFSLTNSHQGSILIVITDILGKRIYNKLINKNLKDHNINFDSDKLPSGIYCISFFDEKNVFSKKINLIHY
ncbi:MAG: T9SS type A sorting domain-containing protein [Bacteroidales bacterium]|nr:T9SS type A sorting domain-containing protein [Bacteroidales bacterium]